MKIFGIIVGLLLLAFATFIYFAGRNYTVTKQQVIDLITKILENNTECWGEWDNFTHIPITNDPFLEAIRKRCDALQQKEFLDPKLESFYNERGKEEIRKILAELKNSKE